MLDLDALLDGIVADPASEIRWLVLADWLKEFDDPQEFVVCMVTGQPSARRVVFARSY